MLILRSDQLVARLDPRHGGEIIDLIDPASGRQLLGRPPFGSTPPVPGDLDEATWTRAYRGGWQMLTPNAGNACVVDGVSHGFHGRASNDPWEVVSHDDASADLTWAGHNLRVHRRYVIEDDALLVQVRVEATRDRTPLIAVEHIALGLEVLDPVVSIELPDAGDVVELDATGQVPPSHEGGGASWPNARMGDGTTCRVDRLSVAEPCSRMLSVSDLAEGKVVVRNPERGTGLVIEWNHDWLKHLWVWQEIRTSDGPWRQLGELLVIEPASVPHHTGLAHAIEHGEALWLDAGQSKAYDIRVCPWRSNGTEA